MDNDMEKALRAWLKENLVLHVQEADLWAAGQDVYVGLRFKDEDRAFCFERISIPTKD